MNQFRRLHLIQVGSTIPGSCDHLPASDQPVSCNHNPLVTFQGGCCDPNSGHLTKALAIHLPFFSVWRVLVIIAWSLQVNNAEHKAILPNHPYACGNKTYFNVNMCYNSLWNSPWWSDCLRRTEKSYSHWHLVVAGGQEAAPCSARCEPSGPQRLRCTSTHTDTQYSDLQEKLAAGDHSGRKEWKGFTCSIWLPDERQKSSTYLWGPSALWGGTWWSWLWGGQQRWDTMLHQASYCKWHKPVSSR